MAAGIPTFSDLDLMITCVVAQFRTNHRNSHIFSVCLDPLSPPVFRLAFVEGLCTVLKEVRQLPPWGIFILYIMIKFTITIPLSHGTVFVVVSRGT